MAKVHILGEQNTIFNHFVAELRDINIQKDRMRFRRNLERMGEVFAYEISKTMDYETKEITTPLGTSKNSLLKEQPVICTILRAGLPLHQGILNYFDNADNAFAAAYRRSYKDGSFDIEFGYLTSPNIDGRTIILCDPMLATGSSLIVAYNALMKKGKPKQIHVANAIASTEGLSYTERHLSENAHIWLGALDDELTAQSYIVPGLGDAGDLAYGGKE